MSQQMGQRPNDRALISLGIFGIKGTIPAQNLPQNATATLVRVIGGMVMITSFIGIVTTAIGATVMNLSIGTVPTVGVASTGAIGAATPFASTPVGSWVTPVQSAGIAGQLAVGSGAGAAVFLATPMIVSAGTITWTTTANNTGQMKWYFTFVPIDFGAALS